MVKDFLRKLKGKKPLMPDSSQSFKQKIKFELSLFTEDWMKMNKEDLKRIFNTMHTCEITCYFINYYKSTKFLKYNIMKKTTRSGEHTREWLENIVADLLQTSFGKWAHSQYNENRFESFNSLIKWVKYVEPFTCINLAYNGEKKNASYTFFLQDFPKEITQHRHGWSQFTYIPR